MTRPTTHGPRPERVVHVIDHLGPGGAQRQLIELVTALPRDQFEVEVICLSTTHTAYAQALRDAGVPVHLIGQSGVWDVRCLRALCRIFHGRRPQLVQTWLFTADLYGRLAARLVGVPVIVSTVRSIEPDKRRRYVWADRLLRHVTDAFIVNARAVGETLQRREGVPAVKLHTIYNGVDLAAFHPTVCDGAIRRRVGLTPGATVIGIVGRLAPVKDHETFLHAAHLVAQRRPDARFLIVGTGPCRDGLQTLARGLQLDERVQFVEHQASAVDAMAAVDVLVVSSRYEGCSNVILEAMAMGKPVVATAVGGNPELVRDGETGYLVQPAAPERLAEALLRFLEEPHRVRTMGCAGRRRAEAKFSRSRMVAETTALYERLSGPPAADHGSWRGARGDAHA